MLERGWWRQLATRALDLLYPPVCALCADPMTHNRWLCQRCAAKLPRIRAPFCGQCGEPFFGKIDAAFSCPNCRKLTLAFDFARATLNGDSPEARTLVHQLKYHRRLELARPLAALLAESFSDPRLARAIPEKWPLIPIPLHRKRLQSRQFNQSEELAAALAREHRLPVVHALRRVRPTPSQTRLSRRQRLANLAHAFALRPAAATLAGRPVILIDDVLTTGATAHQCAKLLKKHAAVSQVAVVTLLRS
jgi:competence protein ComFC